MFFRVVSSSMKFCDSRKMKKCFFVVRKFNLTQSEPSNQPKVKKIQTDQHSAIFDISFRPKIIDRNFFDLKNFYITFSGIMSFENFIFYHQNNLQISCHIQSVQQDFEETNLECTILSEKRLHRLKF